MKKVHTVLGPIDPDQMGITLPHEHLSADLKCLYIPPQDSDRGSESLPWTLDNLYHIQQFPYSHKSNIVLNDSEGEAAVLDSLYKFREVGGGCIVENSSQGWLRKSGYLKDLSAKTGVHIVAGTGYYVERAHSQSILDNATVENITEHLTKEILDGCVDDPTVKCGFIGEIGVSDDMRGIERKAIEAAAETQQTTGAAVGFHPGRTQDSPFDIMRVFLEAGGRPDKAILCHTSRTLQDMDKLAEFSYLGTYIQFDLFGNEKSFYPTKPSLTYPNDAQRIESMLHLLNEEGRSERILASQDIHTKHRLEKFGGHGYKYMVKYMMERMMKKGITPEQLKRIFIDNPAAVFAY